MGLLNEKQSHADRARASGTDRDLVERILAGDEAAFVLDGLPGFEGRAPPRAGGVTTVVRQTQRRPTGAGDVSPR